VPEVGLSSTVLLAVLAAALLHASWNALIRGAGDKAHFTLLLSAASSSLSVAGVIWFGFPKAAAWPFLLASVALHTVYIVWMIRAYEGGGLVLTYTIMRGVPPLIVALVSGPLLGEALKIDDWLGILMICCGVIGIGFASGNSLRVLWGKPATRAALMNAGAIAAYTVVDGYGARLSGDPLSYAASLFMLEPLFILTLSYRRRGNLMLAYFRANWRLGVVGALCSMAAYATILWAMTQAPIAMVAALRETSVIFAVLMGSLWFKEGKPAPALVAALAVVVGIFLLRL
jgi:drug/metabolite transporter (DMT)-like permease